MRYLKSLIVSAFAMFTFLSLAPATLAHAQHPAYLHALSDLRTARGYLQMPAKPQTQDACNRAVKEVSRAISDMEKAVRDYGNNPKITPPPQGAGSANTPIHSAIRLLKEARADVEHGRDLPENHGLRERSIEHIDKALLALSRFQ
ncbi:MAG: hypothetical protein ABR990_04710 [Terracidiphilus sp.]|jgi:hypothetical protein